MFLVNSWYIDGRVPYNYYFYFFILPWFSFFITFIFFPVNFFQNFIIALENVFLFKIKNFYLLIITFLLTYFFRSHRTLLYIYFKFGYKSNFYLLFNYNLIFLIYVFFLYFQGKWYHSWKILILLNLFCYKYMIMLFRNFFNSLLLIGIVSPFDNKT